MNKGEDEIIHQNLFACTECGARQKFVDLTPEEQLCKDCRRKYPLRNCCYCQMEFYWMGDPQASAVCKRCKRDHHVHGKPINCTYCKVKAAFSGEKCFRCQYFEDKYGSPVECNMCKTKCAFVKSEESRKKVQGKTLCYLCTLKLKKTLYREKRKRPSENGNFSLEGKRKTVRDPLNSDIFDIELKHDGREEFTLDSDTLLPGLGDLPTSQAHDQQIVIESLQSEHLCRIEELKDEIGSLRRQINAKDQALREKEKKILGQKAEIWEQENAFKQKIYNSQSILAEKTQEFQETIADLKKQLAKASKHSTLSQYKQ